MSQSQTTPRPRERGEGMIYVGSMVTHHGSVVVSMDDCPCILCQQYDTLDDRKRVTVLLDTGVRLFHARHRSFERPGAGEDPTRVTPTLGDRA